MATGGVSLSELARQLGRAKSGLHKLAKAKQIPQLSDGSFDVAAVQAALEKNVDPARKPVPEAVHQPVHRSPAGERPAKVNGQVVRTVEDAAEAVALIAQILREEGVEAPDSVDYNAARTAETILKARERHLKILQRRKELVPLVQQQKHVSDAIVSIRQVIQRLPSRHGASMAAELGVDAGDLDRVLSRAIAAELEELSRPITKD